MFDEENRHIIRKQIADTLRATVSQKLVYSEENKKRYPAMEIMLVTSTIVDYMRKDNIEEIYNLVKNNSSEGMISLNRSLSDLVSQVRDLDGFL